MARITVLGGTGYVGSNIAAVAADRGHEVVAYSRSVPETPHDGVEYRQGDLRDEATLEAATSGTDVVISALSPRGDLAAPDDLRTLEGRIAARSAANGVRLGVVGGAGSLLVAPGGPKLVDTPDFPEDYRAEANELDGVLEDLRAGSGELEWFFVSPAAAFGPWAAGELTGSFRTGGDVLLADENGDSAISGPDLALAVVLEVEKPAHHQERFTVAY